MFLCSVKNTFAQNESKIDSLLKKYNIQNDDTLKVATLTSLYNSFLYNQPVKAKQYAFEQFNLSKKIKFKKGVAKSLYHIGVYFNNTDEMDSAKVYYNRALEAYKEIGDRKSMANVNHGIAILEYSQGNFENALDILDKNLPIYEREPVDSLSLAISYAFKGNIYRNQSKYRLALNETLKALDIFGKIDSQIRQADALGSLAAIEFHLKNYNLSIKYNIEALEIYTKHNDKGYAAQALNDIGNTYYYLKKYSQSIEYLERSMVLSKETDAKELLATSLGNLGKVYTELNEFEKAKFNLKQSLKIVRKSGNIYKEVESLNDLGIAYNKANEYEKAVSCFNESIALSQEIDLKQNLRIGLLNRSISYSKIGNYKKSLDDHIRSSTIKDSIFNIIKSGQIEELRTIYETEKKEQQIVLQENEIDLLEEKAKVNSLQKALLGSGLVLSLAIVGLGYYGFRQRIKRTRLEKEKVDTLLAFKKKELTTHALHLAKKNEVLESLKQKAKEFKSSENGQNGYQQLIQTINFDLKDDNNWENFTKYFEQVHKDFNANAKNKYPNVTSNELRLMALLKMNLTSKEIANVLNISQDGIKKARQRLRKKLQLSPQDSLTDKILSI